MRASGQHQHLPLRTPPPDPYGVEMSRLIDPTVARRLGCRSVQGCLRRARCGCVDALPFDLLGPSALFDLFRVLPTEIVRGEREIAVFLLERSGLAMSLGVHELVDLVRSAPAATAVPLDGGCAARGALALPIHVCDDSAVEIPVLVDPVTRAGPHIGGIEVTTLTGPLVDRELLLAVLPLSAQNETP